MMEKVQSVATITKLTYEQAETFGRTCSVEEFQNAVKVILSTAPKNLTEILKGLCTGGAGICSAIQNPEIQQMLLFEYATNLEILEIAEEHRLLETADFTNLVLALAENSSLPVDNRIASYPTDHPLVRIFKAQIQYRIFDGQKSLGESEVEALLTIPFQDRRAHQLLLQYAKDVLPFSKLQLKSVGPLCAAIESAPGIANWVFQNCNPQFKYLIADKSKQLAYQLVRASLLSDDPQIFQLLLGDSTVQECIITRRDDFDNSKDPLFVLAGTSPIYNIAVPIFLELGVSVGITNQQGETILHTLYNNYGSHAQMRLQDLFQMGIPVDLPDQNGRTLLMSAIQNSDEDFCELLVSAGAKASSKDHSGKTTEEFALASGNPQILKSVLGVNSRSWGGKTISSTKLR